MNTDTTETLAAAEDSAEKPATQPRKRRMAREPKPQEASASTAAEAAPLEATARRPATPSGTQPTKIAVVLGLLTRREGATLEQMVEVTGWLPHTTRAALTGLRKKGYQLTSAKADGVRTYRVIEKHDEVAEASDPAAAE